MLALAAILGAAAPLAARADDAGALVRDTRAFSRIRSFRVSIEYATGPQTMHSDMIYIAPDRLRIDADAGGVTATRVAIGKLNWVKYGDGKWQKVDPPPGTPDTFAGLHDMNALAEHIHSYVVTYLGTQPLDGKPMHVYQYAVPPKKGFSAKVSRIWIGVADGFPHKIVQSNGLLKATLLYSAFNAPLSVSGPE